MEKKDAGLLDRFIAWREKHIPHTQFVLILSFVVGVLSALAAFALKHLIHFIQHHFCNFHSFFCIVKSFYPMFFNPLI